MPITIKTEDGELTTEDRFELTCKVLKRKKSYRDHQSRGKEWNDTATVILLVPEQTTEASCFFKVWLPEEEEILAGAEDKKDQAYSEIGIRTGFPVTGFFRGALCRGNNLLPQPHIFVMSNRAEKALQSYDGKKIRVTVLGEQEFDEAYEARAETRNPYD